MHPLHPPSLAWPGEAVSCSLRSKTTFPHLSACSAHLFPPARLKNPPAEPSSPEPGNLLINSKLPGYPEALASLRGDLEGF